MIVIHTYYEKNTTRGKVSPRDDGEQSSLERRHKPLREPRATKSLQKSIPQELG